MKTAITLALLSLLTPITLHAQTPAVDIAAAGEACTRYMNSLRSNPASARDALAAATATLDRLNLTEAGLFASMDQAAPAVTGTDRFYVLADLAKLAFDNGQPERAQTYARELLRLAPDYRKDWNYGNAIFYGNFVLGRVALARGNVELAKQYLLDAGSTPGSPQLDTFGPNVTLAKELLEKGQAPTVLRFLALCKEFWKMDRGRLAEWTDAIRSGSTPDFSANLNY